MKSILTAALLMTAVSAGAAELIIKAGSIKGSTPGSDNTLGYLTLHNPHAAAVEIVGIRSDLAEFSELHVHYHRDGRMVMRQLERVVVEAGQTLVMKEHGYHLMLINLNRFLPAQAQVEVVLLFADGTEQALQLPVIDPRPALR